MRTGHLSLQVIASNSDNNYSNLKYFASFPILEFTPDDRIFWNSKLFRYGCKTDDLGFSIWVA
jgi:hypothetical protein